MALPFPLCNAALPCSYVCAQQDHLDIRVIPAFQEVEKEDRNGEKHTMTAVKLQASMLVCSQMQWKPLGWQAMHMYDSSRRVPLALLQLQATSSRPHVHAGGCGEGLSVPALFRWRLSVACARGFCRCGVPSKPWKYT